MNAFFVEMRRNSVGKRTFSPSMEMGRLTRDGTAKSSREIKLLGANGDRELPIFPVQLATTRIGNLTRLTLTLATCDDHTKTSQKKNPK